MSDPPSLLLDVSTNRTFERSPLTLPISFETGKVSEGERIIIHRCFRERMAPKNNGLLSGNFCRQRDPFSPIPLNSPSLSIYQFSKILSERASWSFEPRFKELNREGKTTDRHPHVRFPGDSNWVLCVIIEISNTNLLATCYSFNARRSYVRSTRRIYFIHTSTNMFFLENLRRYPKVRRKRKRAWFFQRQRWLHVKKYV